MLENSVTFICAVVLAAGIFGDSPALGDGRIAKRDGEAKPPKSIAKRPTILEAYKRAERFESGQMSKLVYKANVEAHWIGDSPRFWYRSDVRGKSEFILVDAERGTRAPAFDHARLAAGLSKASGAKCSKDELPFTSVDFAGDLKSIRFRVGSQWWTCDLGSYECVKSEPPENRVVQGRPPETKAEEPRDSGESPDGKWIAWVKDNNVYLKPKEGGTERQLSAKGSAGNPFTAVSWSPDAKYLAAWRTQPGEHPQMYTVESSPDGQVRPKLHQTTYELPGDKVDINELWIFDAASGRETQVETEPIDWWGPPDLRWKPDNRRFTFEQTHRGFQRVRIVEVDAETGKARTVVDERSKTFVWPPCQYSHYVDATDEIIWASERDGWCHLYLIDGRTGEVKNQITRGEWVTRTVEGVDDQARQIIFGASGREPGEDPYLIHYYRVNFDGSGLVCLTPGHGQHTVRFSPDKKHYIDSYSRVDMAPVTEMRRSSDGSLVCTLEKADVRDLLETGWRWPEPFCAKGRDGKTDIWGVIYRPSNLDPTKKCPVIEDIYAGPQDSSVPKTFSAARGQQGLAELGFIVVQIDGMGTGNRSKAFHDVCYKNLGDSGFPDRIAWMRAAAAKYPYMDLTRVGIHGMSAGGYNAAHALIAHPEFYKVAVSISGNHDHRTDKVWWNELWMGYPVGPHYAAQSNIAQARRMRGKLLLVHGEMDDNVNPSASTLQFVNALIKANKDFDLLIVPGAGHGFGPYVQRKLWDYYVRNLLGVEPPREYQIKVDDGSSCNITIRNLFDKPAAIYWIEPDGRLQRYPDVPPGQTVTRHTFIGHQWEAHVDGKPVSWYTASKKSLEWVISPTP